MSPTLSAIGGDTDIDMQLAAKGGGHVKLLSGLNANSQRITNVSTIGATQKTVTSQSSIVFNLAQEDKQYVTLAQNSTTISFTGYAPGLGIQVVFVAGNAARTVIVPAGGHKNISGSFSIPQNGIAVVSGYCPTFNADDFIFEIVVNPLMSQTFTLQDVAFLHSTEHDGQLFYDDYSVPSAWAKTGSSNTMSISGGLLRYVLQTANQLPAFLRSLPFTVPDSAYTLTLDVQPQKVGLNNYPAVVWGFLRRAPAPLIAARYLGFGMHSFNGSEVAIGLINYLGSTRQYSPMFTEALSLNTYYNTDIHRLSLSSAMQRVWQGNAAPLETQTVALASPTSGFNTLRHYNQVRNLHSITETNSLTSSFIEVRT